MHKQHLSWLLLSIAVIIFDQASKLVVQHHLDYATIQPITSFFNLLHVHNYGAAFSVMNYPGGNQRWLLALISLVVSAVLIVWLLTLASHRRWCAAALALIIGGALSNLWGRFTLGYVVDFLDLHIAQYHWPAFNIADAAICVGAMMLIVSFIKHEK